MATTELRTAGEQHQIDEDIRESEVVVSQVFSDPEAYFAKLGDRTTTYGHRITDEDGQTSELQAVTLIDADNGILLELVHLSGPVAVAEQEAGGSDYFARIDVSAGSNRFISVVQPIGRDYAYLGQPHHIVLAESASTSGVTEEKMGLKPVYTKVFPSDEEYHDLLEEFYDILGTDIRWFKKPLTGSEALTT
jgi:hypothetical protein